MIEVKVMLKNGEYEEIDPAKTITIDNGYGRYEYALEDIASLDIYEVAGPTPQGEKE